MREELHLSGGCPSVRERKGGTSNGTFSCRVAAKPMTEEEVQCTETFEIPRFKIPSVNDLPKSPNAPEI